MSVARLLDHLVRILRPGSEETAFGVADGFALVAADVPAGVQRADSSLKDGGAGDVEQGTHRVFFTAAADVKARDLIDVTGGPEAPVVLRVLSATTPRGHHVECMAEVWEGPVPE